MTYSPIKERISDAAAFEIFEIIERLRNFGEDYKTIAKKVGISKDSISKWHRLKETPSVDYAKMFYENLNKSYTNEGGLYGV